MCVHCRKRSAVVYWIFVLRRTLSLDSPSERSKKKTFYKFWFMKCEEVADCPSVHIFLLCFSGCLYFICHMRRRRRGEKRIQQKCSIHVTKQSRPIAKINSKHIFTVTIGETFFFLLFYSARGQTFIKQPRFLMRYGRSWKLLPLPIALCACIVSQWLDMRNLFAKNKSWARRRALLDGDCFPFSLFFSASQWKVSRSGCTRAADERQAIQDLTMHIHS